VRRERLYDRRVAETASHAGADALLARVLPEGLAKPADIPPEIFDAALAGFVAGRRLDMRALARELGIGRATLYRRVRDREHVLGEVIWWLTRHAIARSVHAGARKRRARARVLTVVDALLRDVGAQPSLHRFLDEEPEAALRILTSKHGRIQGGIADALRRLLEDGAAELELGIDPATLAYAIVRIGESFLYADVIADAEPDIDQAMRVIERLVRS
jgi:AcrR family transcriptional regulator